MPEADQPQAGPDPHPKKHRHALCGSRNYPYYPHGRPLEIPRGRGDLKAKLLEGQYDAKLEFPAGCGDAKQKTFRGGSMDIFWNYTLLA